MELEQSVTVASPFATRQPQPASKLQKLVGTPASMNQSVANRTGMQTSMLSTTTTTTTTLSRPRAATATPSTDLAYSKVFHPSTILAEQVDLKPAAYFLKQVNTELEAQQANVKITAKAELAQALDQVERTRLERNTWMAVDLVFRNYMTDPNTSLHAEDGLTERDFVAHLLETDKELRLCRAVVAWLEQTSALDLVQYTADIMYETEDVSFSATQLLLRQGQTTLSNGQALVNSLDLDARTRSGFKLHPDDQDELELLFQKIYVLLRTGQLEKACKLARTCNRPSLSAALQGHMYFHDANADKGVRDQDIQGNPHRALFLNVCRQLCRDDNASDFEKAIFGALSGCVTPMLKVANSWEDGVWSYFNSLLHAKLNTRLAARDCVLPAVAQSQHELKLRHSDAPDLDMQGIFDQLDSEKEAISRGCSNLYCTIQTLLIANDVVGLVEVMEAYASSATQLPTDLSVLSETERGMVGIEDSVAATLRFMANLIITLRRADVPNIDDNERRPACNAVVLTYVRFLMLRHEIECVHVYLAHVLDLDLQRNTLAEFWSTINDPDEQQLCIQLAKETELPVEATATSVVDRVRGMDDEDEPPHDDVSALHDSQQLSETEQAMVRSLDWVLADPALRFEALRQCNAILRRLLGKGKINVLEQVLARVLTAEEHHATPTPRSTEEANVFKEFNDMRDYCDAILAFHNWSALAIKEPTLNDTMQASAMYISKLRVDQEQQRLDFERQRWQTSLQQAAQLAQLAMYKILDRPEPWLVDTEQAAVDGDAEDVRQEQLALLRTNLSIELCVQLHQVLSSLDLHRECLRIADLITVNPALQQAFADNKDALRDFLMLLRTSSLALLDAKHADPLGYDQPDE
eukprot:TRINITY_DN11815_c0_g1_i2.p1 TRINITY_DN11815_c0_g1~~TRINITY_DN11815_c0_g1_i2.p1  ORF type:complete len:946 (+),score=251.94 TRINITY_DN11815_c0_g1_i2:239-2839(+)